MRTGQTRLTGQQWTMIEIEYRAGIRSLREIGEQFGITASAVAQYANKRNWERDISARAKLKAAEIVREEEMRLRTITPDIEEKLAEQNAKILASVQINQRSDVSRAREIVMNLFAELEQISGSEKAEILSRLGELVQSGESAKMKRAYREIISLPSRVKLVKDLSDALKTLITLERTVYGLEDIKEEKGDPLTDLIVRITTSNNNTLMPVDEDSEYDNLKPIEIIPHQSDDDDDDDNDDDNEPEMADDDPRQFDFN